MAVHRLASAVCADGTFATAAPTALHSTGCYCRDRAAPCLDLRSNQHHCRSRPLPSRRAFVLQHDLRPPVLRAKPFVALVSALRRTQTRGYAVVLLVPEERATHHAQTLDELRAHLTVRTHVGPRALSPALRHAADEERLRRGNCCGASEFSKLLALDLHDAFDAIIFLDLDMQVRASLDDAFRCASGPAPLFLATSGPGQPTNGGFFALRPHPRLAAAYLDYLSRSTLVAAAASGGRGGWNNMSSFGPSDRYGLGRGYGAATPQTANYFFFFSADPLAAESWARAAVPWPRAAAMLDRCVWNYQNECKTTLLMLLQRQRGRARDAGRAVAGGPPLAAAAARQQQQVQQQQQQVQEPLPWARCARAFGLAAGGGAPSSSRGGGRAAVDGPALVHKADAGLNASDRCRAAMPAFEMDESPPRRAPRAPLHASSSPRAPSTFPANAKTV